MKSARSCFSLRKRFHDLHHALLAILFCLPSFPSTTSFYCLNACQLKNAFLAASAAACRRPPPPDPPGEIHYEFPHYLISLTSFLQKSFALRFHFRPARLKYIYQRLVYEIRAFGPPVATARYDGHIDVFVFQSLMLLQYTYIDARYASAYLRGATAISVHCASPSFMAGLAFRNIP